MANDEFRNLKLLYVEDEQSIRKYAMSYFNRLFEQTYEASNTNEAYKIYLAQKPQIVVTDIKMENLSGIELLKKIRAIDKKCQLVVLSAFLDTKYLLEAIELNLVKYLSKPINHEELYSVLLQCANNITQNDSKKIEFSSSCYFDLSNKTLINDNTNIKLTKNELYFLELLCLNKTRTVTYQEIENIIWYDSVMSENALRLLVKKLRKKLPHNTLENIAKLGYKIKCL